ncbi:hypothetical protein HMPREF1624_02724 [Sporothrix schenckii ATCC 58251]|uniref:SUN domain-containing protein n=1 Tax=Sporothrix schenckii (strain ATCC 58251 / de Perez 2211183) TaxID=1391915 RepID=U7Q3A9_SPOS1|nr:hypothetical protein HMPREF1624_02724 [Sporothrix schenckii ATCC 58251]
MPRGFMLYVSAAAVGLLGFGRPVPAEATDASPTAAMSTPIPDAAAVAEAAAIASSVNSPSSESTVSISSSTSSTSSTATTVSVTMSQPSSASSHATSSSHISSSSSVAGSFDTETCQSKTINYITHTLPQQCLRTSWSSANATATTTDTKDGAGSSGHTMAAPSETASAAETAHGREAKEIDKEKGKDDDENQEDLATESFMSFEEWKALQLKKAGQDPAELQARRRQHQNQYQHQNQHHAGQHAHGAGGDINIDSIGDDGEIALDFDVLNEKVSEMAGSASARPPDQYRDGSGGGYRQDGSAADGGNTASGSSGSGTGAQDEAVVYADGATQYYRSKDAGKTGKERFSFASFDAGATVLKANKGVKNAKAILVENKDSYMLLECRTRDKHVIVELSDDILVDTVVLANFEFFSSMVRRFRVGVSDRYPVKADRWRTLGEFEARNSRDIQPFLIEHPQIWAKYIRIDFLTHYGSEYYCPISLLRVHGTRMLDSWKDSENGRDGEDDEELENQEQYEGNGQQNQNQNQYNQQLAEEDRKQKQADEHAQHTQAETIAAPEASPAVDDSATNFSADADAHGLGGYTPWNPVAAYLGLFNADAVCLPSVTPDGSSDSSVANADDSSAPGSSQEQRRAMPVEAHAEINNQSSSETPEPASASSVQPPEHASTPTHTQTAAKRTSAESASNPPQSASTSSIASTASDASQPSQSSEPAASPSSPTAKAPEQAVSAQPQSAKQKPGSVGSQQTPPTTTTVQTSHSRNRAASGGAGAAGSSSQSGGSPSGSTGGSGYNPGATPGGGGQGSASTSSSGGNNNGASTGGAQSPPPPPIVQESFFKSITKRLQLLESNTSLSLQYIEDQSRFLQEALRKMERKQIARVDSFLDTLNNTVLSELRNMRQQYDQIWQSTVIALETQREQNQRETVALSDRLNVLADEVVFQKRMAILQSVLLLCCLALVIFSRGLLSSSSASVPLDVNTATAAAMAAAAGYMPAGPAMSPSPASPPSASSSVGLRSNLRSLRNNLRNPYAAYSVYASDYPLSSYAAGSPPPSNLRTQPMPVRGGGAASAVPAPINKNKVLPLIPTTPTSPASPGSPVSPEPIVSNDGQDSMLDVDDRATHVMQEKGKGPVLVEPKSLTPLASLRLSDIEEAADQLEDEEDSGEDHDDETVLSEATTVRPDGNNRTILGGSDSLGLFTPTAVTPTKLNGTADDLSSSSMTTSFLPGTGSSEAPPGPPLGRKRLASLSDDHSN